MGYISQERVVFFIHMTKKDDAYKCGLPLSVNECGKKRGDQGNITRQGDLL